MFLLTACNSKRIDESASLKQNKTDTIIKHDTIYLNTANDTSWQEGFGLTHDPDKDSIWHKPVSYYLNDTKLSPLAFEFYYGYFRPSDNGATDELFKYVATSNDKLRPFYRWCLYKTIQISDGALWGHVGEPAKQYAEKFPLEFFEYIDSDTSGAKYNEWTRAIYLTEIEESDDKKFKSIKVLRAANMRNNCKSCNVKTIKRIDKFIADCYE